MKFGLFCSAQANSGDLGPETGQGFRDYLDFNIEAEALGFRSSFLVEHHFTGWNQVSSTLMLLMALAMRTKTLRLGSAVMVLPWHNPVLLAEQAATLDLISGGRFDFGVGKGYRHSEFKGFQIAPEEAEARFEEAIEVMTHLNTVGADVAERGLVRAAVDVTGFGLLSHLGAMCASSKVGAEISAASVPAISRNTISTPNASASTLLVLSGPVVMWRKKIRCTPIWATARATSAAAMPGVQSTWPAAK